MNNILDYLKVVVAFVGGIVSLLFQTATPFLTVLLILVVIDYITGIIKGVLYQELSSARGFKGLFKKFMILIVVTLGALIDTYVVKTSGVLTAACCTFYIANESISIIENSAAIGVPIPKKLTDILEQLKGDNPYE